MRRGTLEIAKFEPRQATAEAVRAECPRELEGLLDRLRREYRTLTSFAAAVVALGLHIPFVAPVLWGGGPFAHSRERTYQGDTAALQWIVFDDSSGRSAAIRLRSGAAPTLRSIGVTDALPKLPAPTAEASGLGAGRSGDRAGLGAMYGRYLGQIQARVDRAWLRPRTAIGGPIFQCQVQMDQDGTGRVLAVTLLKCNGDTTWQLSLVHAIESASPLPAPPNPAVFVHHVLLTFRAFAYSRGTPAQLYEPPRAVQTVGQGADHPLSPDPFQALAQTARARPRKSMKLRIEGSNVERWARRPVTSAAVLEKSHDQPNR